MWVNKQLSRDSTRKVLRKDFFSITQELGLYLKDAKHLIDLVKLEKQLINSEIDRRK